MATKLLLKPHIIIFPNHIKTKTKTNLSLTKPFSSSSSSTTSIKMSSSQIIEHIVLFKTKPNTPQTQLDSMLNNLNALKTLPQVIHISAGPLAKTRSSPIPFTHILHSRYKTVEDLETYSAHPRHVSVVTQFVKPVCEDIMAVDWVAKGLLGGPEIGPGKGVRVNLVKLKDGVRESERNEILGGFSGIKEKFEGFEVEELSYGENFSAARAKGFSIGSITVVPGLEELERLGSEWVDEEKAKGFIESVIVLDYLVPHVQVASL